MYGSGVFTFTTKGSASRLSCGLYSFDPFFFLLAGSANILRMNISLVISSSSSSSSDCLYSSFHFDIEPQSCVVSCGDIAGAALLQSGNVKPRTNELFASRMSVAYRRT